MTMWYAMGDSWSSSASTTTNGSIIVTQAVGVVGSSTQCFLCGVELEMDEESLHCPGCNTKVNLYKGALAALIWRALPVPNNWIMIGRDGNIVA